jgi:2-methylisocitrate lyase-like PEP mutase family enzyme
MMTGWPDPAHPQQGHLDVIVDGPDQLKALGARAEKLGATRLADGDAWITLADPAGHPFDLSTRDRRRQAAAKATVRCGRHRSSAAGAGRRGGCAALRVRVPPPPTRLTRVGSAGVIEDARAAFRLLHTAGTFVIPNPWDVPSARLLEHLGFPALATTSSGFAASLGRADQRVTRDELVTHVATLTAAVQVPVSVDAERGYADDPAGVAETVRLLAEAGASGVSIEDYDPASGRIEPVEVAVERVAAAAGVCTSHGMVLTGRAENHLYGSTDLDDTIARLTAYRDAGATCLYAPGLADPGDIARLVEAVGAAVNVLALRDGPTVAQLAGIGVRRVSTGGSLAWAAYGALVAAATELRDTGTSTYLDRALPRPVRDAAFD